MWIENNSMLSKTENNHKENYLKTWRQIKNFVFIDADEFFIKKSQKFFIYASQYEITLPFVLPYIFWTVMW